MKIAVIAGSPRRDGNTQIMMRHVYERVSGGGDEAVFVNLAEGIVDCYRGPGEDYSESTLKAAADLTGADVWLVGTPVYNSLFSSALKNLFEYLDYKKTPGKTAGIAVLGAGQISFVDVQTVLTQLMSYFGILTNPKAVFLTTDSIKDGRLDDRDAIARLDEMADRTLALARRG